MNRFRTVDRVFAICAASLVVACNDDGPSAPAPVRQAPLPLAETDLQGTWALEPRVAPDCGFAVMVVDTVKTKLKAPGVMTFTLKGHVHSDQALEQSADVTLDARKSFSFRGSRTYSYASFNFYVVGEFIDRNSVSAVVRVDGTIGHLGCDSWGPAAVIGHRVR